MAKAATPPTDTAKALYQRLSTDREPFLETGRYNARLTIPTLLPPEGAGPSWRPEKLYQSIGARGVANLAAKLLLALLPPNTSFLRLRVDDMELKKLASDRKARSALDEALGEIEQAVGVEVETSAVRTTASEIFLHLIVSGNGLLEVPKEGPLKFYRLDRYVVERDPMGHLLTVVVHEKVAPSALPEEFQKAVAAGSESKDKFVDLYTVARRKAAKWEVWQEGPDGVLPDSRITHSHCPFLPLRFTRIDGENYGRGYCELYSGDLWSLEALSNALVDGALAASKVLFLVQPGGTTDATTLAEASNGAFVDGRADDVHALQLEKYADFSFVAQQAQAIEKRLEMAFLMTTAVQRNAERVTAEEVRALVQELETSLGGIYTSLAQDFQLPLAEALMDRMARQGRLPKLPKKVVRPTITTGVEALGRGNDLSKLRSFVSILKETGISPEVLNQRLDLSDFITRIATALAINAKGLVRPPEEVAAEQQQQAQMAQLQELATKLGPEALRQMGQQMQTNTA